MRGNITGDTIIGKLTTETSITGTLTTNSQLTGNVINGEGISRSYYSESYEVAPQTSSQTLDTKEKIMSNDITIKPIPFKEVHNQYGDTVYIGTEE